MYHMSALIDLTGEKYGYLTVMGRAPQDTYYGSKWRCKCVCGKECVVLSSNLRSGRQTSCGCIKTLKAIQRNTTHGVSGNAIYTCWKDMIHRCENPRHASYPDYGGRGIKICEEWHEPKIFYDWSISHGWKKGLTLDRIDNDRDYEPSNCRWTTWEVQANNKRKNHSITYNGKTQTIAQWSIECDIPYDTLYSRIAKRGWNIERALTTPVKRKDDVDGQSRASNDIRDIV